jgi:hypothetical protein
MEVPFSVRYLDRELNSWSAIIEPTVIRATFSKGDIAISADNGLVITLPAAFLCAVGEWMRKPLWRNRASIENRTDQAIEVDGTSIEPGVIRPLGGSTIAITADGRKREYSLLNPSPAFLSRMTVIYVSNRWLVVVAPAVALRNAANVPITVRVGKQDGFRVEALSWNPLRVGDERVLTISGGGKEVKCTLGSGNSAVSDGGLLISNRFIPGWWTRVITVSRPYLVENGLSIPLFVNGSEVRCGELMEFPAWPEKLSLEFDDLLEGVVGVPERAGQREHGKVGENELTLTASRKDGLSPIVCTVSCDLIIRNDSCVPLTVDGHGLKPGKSWLSGAHGTLRIGSPDFTTVEADLGFLKEKWVFLP